VFIRHVLAESYISVIVLVLVSFSFQCCFFRMDKWQH